VLVRPGVDLFVGCGVGGVAVLKDGAGSVNRPVMYDAYSCAGGAGFGYHLAGFRVIGIDNRPQPNYPFEFHEADALDVLRAVAEGREPWPGAPRPDAIHGSPTCQTFARVTDWRGSRDDHPDLLTPTLEILSGVSIPWIVENVREACPPLRPDLIVCGSHFGLDVHRERAFQFGNWSAYELYPPCQCRRNPDLLPFMHKNERAFADAMGCTWMSAKEARQAVPPPYTEHIGRQLLSYLASEAAA
jgi:DNA (cytosine-5)-methyltransferase 1